MLGRLQEQDRAFRARHFEEVSIAVAVRRKEQVEGLT